MKFLNITPPAAIIDNAAVTTTEIDTKGYRYLTVVASLGATDIAMSVLKLTESDTSGSGHADISSMVFGTATDIDGDTSSLPSATDDNGMFVFKLDLRGHKRYIDVSATVGDGTNGTFISILGCLERDETGPTTLAGYNATGMLMK